MFLSADEAAAVLRCNADTVRRLAASGTIPGRKLGRRWLFDPDQLRAYVRGEWHSSSERPAGRGGLDSQYAVALFDAPATPRTAPSPKSTKRPFDCDSGGKPILVSLSTPGGKPSPD